MHFPLQRLLKFFITDRPLTRRHFSAVIERICARYIEKGRFFSRDKVGNSAALVSSKGRSFAKLLARQVTNGQYLQGPAIPIEVVLNGKRRTIYKFELKDKIVHSALYDIVSNQLESILSPRVYSYRRTCDWWDAVGYFTKYVRTHRQRVQQRTSQGLYVLRTDVKSYATSIPLHSRSYIWQALSVIAESAGKTGPKIFSLVQSAIRPAVEPGLGAPHSPLYGVPFGSPLCCAAYNIYLHEVDLAMESHAHDGFYARYGDDILFAHENYEVVRSAEKLLLNMLSELELCVGKNKHILFHFTNCGRYITSNPDVRGTDFIRYLGVQIRFDATVTLKAAELRKVKKELRKRITYFNNSLPQIPATDRADQLCAFAKQLLDPSYTHSLPTANMLKKCVTDRQQLKDLDAYIAQIIAEQLSGIRGPKAFRSISYRSLRATHGLFSLCRERNFYGKSFYER